MITELFLMCALAPSPWAFIDPLSVEAKIENIAEMMTFKERYPDWEFQFYDKRDPKPQANFEPTPWVFKEWRLYARRSA